MLQGEVEDAPFWKSLSNAAPLPPLRDASALPVLRSLWLQVLNDFSSSFSSLGFQIHQWRETGTSHAGRSHLGSLCAGRRGNDGAHAPSEAAPWLLPCSDRVLNAQGDTARG